jgi:hypothetical protein
MLICGIHSRKAFFLSSALSSAPPFTQLYLVFRPVRPPTPLLVIVVYSYGLLRGLICIHPRSPKQLLNLGNDHNIIRKVR